MGLWTNYLSNMQNPWLIRWKSVACKPSSRRLQHVWVTEQIPAFRQKFQSMKLTNMADDVRKSSKHMLYKVWHVVHNMTLMHAIMTSSVVSNCPCLWFQQSKIHKVLREVFSAATQYPPPRGVGHSPQSRAMYGVDIMLKWQIQNG